VRTIYCAIIVYLCHSLVFQLWHTSAYLDLLQYLFLPRDRMQCNARYCKAFLSVCLSVCQTRALWQNERNLCSHTQMSFILVSSQEKWLVGTPFLSEILGQADPVRAKSYTDAPTGSVWPKSLPSTFDLERRLLITWKLLARLWCSFIMQCMLVGSISEKSGRIWTWPLTLDLES